MLADAPFRTRREFLTVLAAAAVIIVMLTLVKPYVDIPGFFKGGGAHRSLDFQLLNGFDHPRVWWGPWLNTFGNVALFLPLGIALAAWPGRRIAWLGRALPGLRRGEASTTTSAITTAKADKAALLGTVGLAGLIGAVTSVIVEVTQYVFALGYSDLDDVVCNTVGAAAGAFLRARSAQGASPSPSQLHGGVIFSCALVCTLALYGLAMRALGI